MIRKHSATRCCMRSLFGATSDKLSYIVFVVALNRIQNILISVQDTKRTQNRNVAESSLFRIANFFRFPKVEGHSENAKLIWLVRLRWMAIGLFFCMAGPGYIFGALNRTTLTIFIGIVGILFIFNLLTQLVFVESKHAVGPLFVGFQLAFDLAVLTSLLLISGSFGNPFVALFLLNAGLGGVLIRGRNSWPFLVLCHAFLIALQIVFALNDFKMNPQTFWILVFVSHVLLFSVWLVLRSLGTYLEWHFESLTQSRILTEKQDRLRAIGALAAGFSHEFASPLNAAKLRLDRLQRAFEKIDLSQNWSENAKENLTEAKASILNCEAVIHSMNASQLDVRDHHLRPINMNEFIQDVMDSWKEEHPEACFKVENQIKRELLVSPINLAQVILNILDNAYEANPKGEISLKLKEEAQIISLSVDDQGPGFSELVLSRQSEPFITTKQNGTGLGLYVSEIFAQSLGGQLSIQNKSNSQGAVVTLSWPLLRGDA
jgi:two-component system sensor histidine kinase RegB